jgi:hypothetical protein
VPPAADVRGAPRDHARALGRRALAGRARARRPFRAPHHTASHAGLVGGGSPPVAGEITLAHAGLLFLDELPEFRRETLEALRQPIESGTITISRAGRRLDLPARFQLVCAMNPCPCGYRGHATIPCRCPPGEVFRYRRRISGPLLDRIELRLELAAPEVRALGERPGNEERGSELLVRVRAARERASARQGPRTNGELDADALDRVAPLEKRILALLERATASFGLSARAVQALRRVARTLADLRGATAEERHPAGAGRGRRHAAGLSQSPERTAEIGGMETRGKQEGKCGGPDPSGPGPRIRRTESSVSRSPRPPASAVRRRILAFVRGPRASGSGTGRRGGAHHVPIRQQVEQIVLLREVPRRSGRTAPGASRARRPCASGRLALGHAQEEQAQGLRARRRAAGLKVAPVGRSTLRSSSGAPELRDADVAAPRARRLSLVTSHCGMPARFSRMLPAAVARASARS